jgi:hypothetical protein
LITSGITWHHLHHTFGKHLRGQAVYEMDIMGFTFQRVMKHLFDLLPAFPLVHADLLISRKSALNPGAPFDEETEFCPTVRSSAVPRQKIIVF